MCSGTHPWTAGPDAAGPGPHGARPPAGAPKAPAGRCLPMLCSQIGTKFAICNLLAAAPSERHLGPQLAPNLQSVIYWPRCLPLSSRHAPTVCRTAWLQAEALGERLACERFAAVFSSDLRRSQETAELILAAQRRAAACSGGSSGSCGAGQEEAEEEGREDPRTDATLRERHLGCLQGLTRREAVQLHPDAYASLAAPCRDPGEVRRADRPRSYACGGC